MVCLMVYFPPWTASLVTGGKPMHDLNTIRKLNEKAEAAAQPRPTPLQQALHALRVAHASLIDVYKHGASELQRGNIVSTDLPVVEAAIKRLELER